MAFPTRLSAPKDQIVASPIHGPTGRLEAQIDAIMAGAAKLEGTWSIEHHVDYEGNASIVLIPEVAAESALTIIIYPGGGTIGVAAVSSDSYAELGSCRCVEDAIRKLTSLSSAIVLRSALGVH